MIIGLNLTYNQYPVSGQIMRQDIFQLSGISGAPLILSWPVTPKHLIRLNLEVWNFELAPYIIEIASLQSVLIRFNVLKMKLTWQ
jgi:hypothetical protein